MPLWNAIASPAGDVEPPTRAGQLSAAGSLSQAHASLGRRVWLAAELILLLVVAPIAMRWAVHGAQIPLFLALVPVLAVALVLLLADPTFSLGLELRQGFGWRTALTIALVFVVAGGAVAYWVREVHPDWFLEFPRNRPETWRRIMLLYPLASVAAQELVYRSFYFHRYGPLFGSEAWLGILVNGLLFGFGHIVVGSPFALVTTALTGLLFSVRYATSRSYWAVFIEHTLWGWLVFTVGLGRYFFTGIANV